MTLKLELSTATAMWTQQMRRFDCQGADAKTPRENMAAPKGGGRARHHAAQETRSL